MGQVFTSRNPDQRPRRRHKMNHLPRYTVDVYMTWYLETISVQ